jgi:chromodomain-helicase-DNA-binding protein 7
MSEKLFSLISDPRSKGWWRSTIEDTGDDTPLFRVWEVAHPEICYEGSTPSHPWALILGAIHDMDTSVRKVGVSGPAFFGFSHPTVLRWMNQLRRADECGGSVLPTKRSPSYSSEASDHEPQKAASSQSLPGRCFKVNFRGPLTRARNLQLTRDFICEEYQCWNVSTFTFV